MAASVGRPPWRWFTVPPSAAREELNHLLAASIAYLVLQTAILHGQGPTSRLRQALGSAAKGKASPLLYLAGVGCALLGHQHSTAWVYVGVAIFVAVAILWLVPDRRIERLMSTEPETR
jgi:hypothetical protein